MIEYRDGHISAADCNDLLRQLAELDRSRFFDRKVHRPNRSITGEVPDYRTMGEYSCPAELRNGLTDMAADLSPLQLEEVVVNWYPPGCYIGPHIDSEGFLAFGILTLDNRHSVFRYYPDGAEGEPVVVSDSPGRLLIIHDPGLVHEVMPVATERYSIIYLYK